ncbi:MAG: hypothetical protein WAW37_00690 [Syntrophobacteraceae bacterium]
MKTTVHLCFLFLASLLLATSSGAQSSGVAPVDYSQYGRPPVSVKVLLLLPEEFQRFEYTATYEGDAIRHPLGQEGARELRAAFEIEFASVDVWSVRSEAEAMAMLTPGDPDNMEVRTYDYVVIPKFMRVDSSVEHQKYGFDIDLLTEFYAGDGATVTKIKGHGESSTGKWFASTPEEGARIALQYAVSAILDGVEGNRSLFVSYEVDSSRTGRNALKN